MDSTFLMFATVMLAIFVGGLVVYKKEPVSRATGHGFGSVFLGESFTAKSTGSERGGNSNESWS